MAPSKQGIILLITNYTGDRLHFGLAAERAKAEGLAKNIIILPATDDVSIGRSNDSHMGVEDYQVICSHLVIVMCQVETSNFSIPDDVCVVGAGISNEPGQLFLNQASSVEELIERCLPPQV
ncbi:hypothetical protein N7454_003025 [Penicillium verhagenii]|nr:hypothetical protein N7454_003025 [Penicillium verhagenii]